MTYHDSLSSRHPMRVAEPRSLAEASTRRNVHLATYTCSLVYVCVCCHIFSRFVFIVKVSAERFAGDRDGRDAGERFPGGLFRVLGHSAPRY